MYQITRPAPPVQRVDMQESLRSGPDPDVQALDIQVAVQAEPHIQRFLCSKPGKLIMGSCPICKKQVTDWNQLKEHVRACRRAQQHPLLMRFCYCPYCLKKLSDAYSLSSHVHTSHSPLIHNITDQLTEKYGKNDRIELDGEFTKKMPQPFPFACSVCQRCWPTVKGLADHFIDGEINHAPCGGIHATKIKPGTRRLVETDDNVACDRYDFAAPVTCPFCPRGFEEAFALSRHIQLKHKQLQEDRERKHAAMAEKHAVKKLYYLPFFCSGCKSTFKTMEQWSFHVHVAIVSHNNPCNGELKIMKMSNENGQTKFTSNVPPVSLNEAGEAVSVAPAAPPPNPPVPIANAEVKEEPLPTEDHGYQRQIKDEPIDPDEVLITQSPVPPADPTPASGPPAAAFGHAVVKDEPMDEEMPEDPAPVPAQISPDNVKVKEEPMDLEPSTSHAYQPGRVKDEPISQEEDEDLECEECNLKFFDSHSFVAHMKGHGYELAEDLDEEQLARLEAGLDAGPPAPKKRLPDIAPATSYNLLSSSRLVPLVSYTSPDKEWFPCKQCDEMCTTASEYREHVMHAHSQRLESLPNAYACTICKKRKFENGWGSARVRHEKECRIAKKDSDRERAFSCAYPCPFCNRRQETPFVLAAHLHAEHKDTLQKLRRNHLMSSEFLPFRCNTCHVGFEDPKLLLNHFRMREEYNMPCFGSLAVHSYITSIEAADRMERTRENKGLCVMVPELPELPDDEYENPDSKEYCPRDPPPWEVIDINTKAQCIHCVEQWPKEQMQLHMKMEHPKQYYDMSTFKCKRCHLYGFYCHYAYAEHYESCVSPSTPGTRCDKAIVCAPRNGTMMVPASNRYRLPPVPDEMGNEMRACRFCKKLFSPEGLLIHQKNDHTVEHYTDAPYHCLKCDEVGFYSHKEYRSHVKKCTGVTPANLDSSLFAITAKEVQRRWAVKKIEIPSYNALVAVDRRKYGTLASFYRPVKCIVCNKWCSSLPAYSEHKADAHPNRDRDAYPFQCGGCARVFKKHTDLRMHLMNENNEGNTQCYDMAMLNGTGLCNTYARMSNIVPRLMAYRPSTVAAGMAPRINLPLTNWRSEGTSFLAVSAHKNLARKEHAEKKFNQLLPIKPLNLYSKSPLSGERFSHPQQSREAKVKNYYKQMTVEQRQKAIIKVDRTAPLDLKQYGEEPSSSGMSYQSTRTSFLTGRPVAVHIGSRPFIGLHSMPNRSSATHRGIPTPHPRTGSSSVTLPSGSRFVRVPSSVVEKPIVFRPVPGTKAPKTEPKQEPQF